MIYLALAPEFGWYLSILSLTACCISVGKVDWCYDIEKIALKGLRLARYFLGCAGKLAVVCRDSTILLVSSAVVL